MADRRMFAKTIVTSDAFLDMPPSARCLYFLLAMLADDDGFVNAPNSIMRQAGATLDDMKLLITKRFVLTFASGVVVIKHWKIHNLIQKDRYKETTYLEEKAMLKLDDKKAYTEAFPTEYPECIQAVSKVDTQVRLGKDRLESGKDSIGEVIEEVEPPKTTRHKYGFYNHVLLSDEEYQKLTEEFPHDYTDRIERLSEYIASKGAKYKSHLATIRSWARKDTHKPAGRKGGNVFLEIAQEEGIV